MSRVIGVLNYKGGTGMTTTVVNLAAGLALRGARVLCIDLDAQGSMATHLGVEYTHSLTHLLLGQVRAQACITQARENLDLIGGNNGPNTLYLNEGGVLTATPWSPPSRDTRALALGDVDGDEEIFRYGITCWPHDIYRWSLITN